MILVTCLFHEEHNILPCYIFLDRFLTLEKIVFILYEEQSAITAFTVFRWQISQALLEPFYFNPLSAIFFFAAVCFLLNLVLLIFLCRYDYYSFSIIPAVGEVVAGDRDSYQYLVESIRRFPSQVIILLYSILRFTIHCSLFDV